LIKERQEFFADQLKVQEARASKTPALADFFPHGPQAKLVTLPTTETSKTDDTTVSFFLFLIIVQGVQRYLNSLNCS